MPLASHRSARFALLVGGIGCLAACGASPARSDHDPPHAARPASAPCVPRARDAVARAAGAAAMTPLRTGSSPGEATCVYRAGGLRVDVRVDANPQAEVRFDRAVVERDQVAIWSRARAQAPRLVQGVGVAADWFPAERELLTTDGHRIVSVMLVRAPHRPSAALRLGRRVARATLRPDR